MLMVKGLRIVGEVIIPGSEVVLEVDITSAFPKSVLAKEVAVSLTFAEVNAKDDLAASEAGGAAGDRVHHQPSIKSRASAKHGRQKPAR